MLLQRGQHAASAGIRSQVVDLARKIKPVGGTLVRY